jgi:hypothetical protein
MDLVQEILKVAPDHPEALRLSRIAKDAIAYEKTGKAQYAETRLAELPKPRAAPTASVVRPPTLPRPDRAHPVATPSRGRTKTIAIGIASVVLVVGAFIVYRGIQSAPSVAHGYVALNISPWAQVTKIVDTTGAEVPFNGATVTPCRLVLPEGSYNITLSNPSFEKPLVVPISVRNDQVQEVRRKFPDFDYQQVLSKLQ